MSFLEFFIYFFTTLYFSFHKDFVVVLQMDQADTVSALERLLARIIPCSISIDWYTYLIFI